MTNTVAVSEIDKTTEIKKRVAGHLRAKARLAWDVNQTQYASDLTQQATEVNQENLRLYNARLKLLSQRPIQPALDRMRQITRDAEQVERDIEAGAEILNQARILVQIITRVSGLFS